MYLLFRQISSTNTLLEGGSEQSDSVLKADIFIYLFILYCKFTEFSLLVIQKSFEAAPGNILMEESTHLVRLFQHCAAIEKSFFFPKLNSGVKLGCLWENIPTHKKITQEIQKVGLNNI